MVIKNTSKAKKLGDLLVEVGLITAAQLKQAVEHQHLKGGRLGDALAELNFLSREVLLSFLGKRCGVSFISLAEFGAPSSEALQLVPESVARNQVLLPLRRQGDTLTVAMADPLNVFATDDLKILTGCDIQVVIAEEAEIKAALDQSYGGACAVPSVDGQVQFDKVSEAASAAGQEAQASNLINVLLDNAARVGAVAVHLEPAENAIKVRYRLGGKLSARPDICGKFQEGLAARVKALARLDPSVGSPQEGHIRARGNGRELDIRVSTMPTFYGEKIVLRLTDALRPDLDLGRLGFSPDDVGRARKALESPAGLYLVTGPAGAGKTLTFYALLKALSKPDRHVATLEDPVDRCIPGLVQVQVRPHAGLSVPSGLRALLRQDPDVIGVGEIRDAETAQAVFEVLQSGIPVVATLRASTSHRALARLLEWGVSPEAAASALRLWVSQRWAKALCADCRESYNLPRQTLADMGFPEEVLKASSPSGSITLARGKGCSSCAKTSSAGRSLLAAASLVDEEFRAEVKKGAQARLPTAAALREAALRKALAGEISLEEALR